MGGPIRWLALRLHGVLCALLLPSSFRRRRGRAMQEVWGEVVRGSGSVAPLAGVAAGTLLAMGGLDLLESRLFGLGESRLVAFAASAVVIAAVTLLATWLPARRAVRVDPVSAMRVE